ncbi:MAG: hypothetical protein KGD64_02770 [Candidatus Heimdallarchaeota archaeon]|nr:hypothetical protein [Candidatus Heimdallarchaeota archaeon]
MVFRKWKKRKYEREMEKKRKDHEILDRAFKKKMKKGYEEGLRQNLQFRSR